MKMNAKLFQTICNEYAYLYLIKLSNDTESFYKIGVTSKEDIESRFTQMPYDHDIVALYKHTSASFIFDLEQKLIKLCEKYVPLKSFCGYSECVVDLEPALEFIETLSWIKGLENHVAMINADAREAVKRKLGTANFTKMCKEYIEALNSKDHEAVEFIETYDDIFKHARKEFGIGVQEHLSAISYQRSRLEVRLNIQKGANSEMLRQDILSSFNIGFLYTKDAVKKKIQNMYDASNVKKTAKATTIKEFFEVKDAKNSDGDNCFKIIRKI